MLCVLPRPQDLLEEAVNVLDEAGETLPNVLFRLDNDALRLLRRILEKLPTAQIHFGNARVG